MRRMDPVVSEAQVQQTFVAMHTDLDGIFTEDEFMAWLEARLPQAIAVESDDRMQLMEFEQKSWLAEQVERDAEMTRTKQDDGDEEMKIRIKALLKNVKEELAAMESPKRSPQKSPAQSKLPNRSLASIPHSLKHTHTHVVA
jgi:hypothetical protein